MAGCCKTFIGKNRRGKVPIEITHARLVFVVAHIAQLGEDCLLGFRQVVEPHENVTPERQSLCLVLLKCFHRSAVGHSRSMQSHRFQAALETIVNLLHNLPQAKESRGQRCIGRFLVDRVCHMVPKLLHFLRHFLLIPVMPYDFNLLAGQVVGRNLLQCLHVVENHLRIG